MRKFFGRANFAFATAALLSARRGLSPYEQAVLALNPDAWWRLDEASGLTAVDSVGGWNAVATTGVTVNQTGAGANTGKAFDLNGTNNNLGVPYSAALGTKFNYAGAFWIVAWVKPDDYENISPRIIDFEAAWLFFMSGGNLTFQVPMSTTNAAAPYNATLTTGAWNFVAGMISAAHAPKVYIANAANGWTVTESPTSPTTGVGTRGTESTYGIGIGYRQNGPGRWMDGGIDSVAIGSGNPTLAQLQGVVDAAAPFDDGPYSGAWSWFTEPRAQRVGNRTFLAGVDASGNARAYDYNHATDFMRSVILHSTLGADDHNNPALLVRASDSRLLAFYSAHNGSEYYLRVSTNPLDATAWGTEATLDSSLGMDSYTYANPIQLTGETNDPIWLFFRGDPPGATGWAQYFSKSEDGGATWAAATRWLANGSERPYAKFIQNGDSRIDFACTDGHPVEVAGCSIYHGYYQGGNVYQSDGTLVGAIDAGPYLPSAFTQVYDGASVEAWVHDIVIDVGGNPVIAYAAFESTTDHRYRYAKWSGSAWIDNEIVAAGTNLYTAQLHYSGGISIDPADVNTVYLSREAGDADWEIWRYITADDGESWSGTKLTTESGRALRPYVVRGHGSDKKVAYFAGTYTSYTSYDTVIKLIDG